MSSRRDEGTAAAGAAVRQWFAGPVAGVLSVSSARRVRNSGVAAAVDAGAAFPASPPAEAATVEVDAVSNTAETVMRNASAAVVVPSMATVGGGARDAAAGLSAPALGATTDGKSTKRVRDRLADGVCFDNVGADSEGDSVLEGSRDADGVTRRVRDRERVTVGRRVAVGVPVFVGAADGVAVSPSDSESDGRRVREADADPESATVREVLSGCDDGDTDAAREGVARDLVFVTDGVPWRVAVGGSDGVAVSSTDREALAPGDLVEPGVMLAEGVRIEPDVVGVSDSVCLEPVIVRADADSECDGVG
jgi:hypothetical protein